MTTKNAYRLIEQSRTLLNRLSCPSTTRELRAYERACTRHERRYAAYEDTARGITRSR